MSTYDFCKIFVRLDDPDQVMNALSGMFGGAFERRSLTLDFGIIDVLRNPDFTAESDDFVQWPVVVELEAQEPADAAVVVTAVSRILTVFWGTGSPAVAACDFEDELPWKGGIEQLTA